MISASESLENAIGKMRADMLNTPQFITPPSVEGGKRYPCGRRFDLLAPEFIAEMAMIMDVGAKKYGELNWQKGLTGEKGGVNHAQCHLNEYMQNLPCDYGPRETHLAQVAINAMFEFYFERQRRLYKETDPGMRCLVPKPVVPGDDNVPF